MMVRGLEAATPRCFRGGQRTLAQSVSIGEVLSAGLENNPVKETERFPTGFLDLTIQNTDHDGAVTKVLNDGNRE